MTKQQPVTESVRAKKAVIANTVNFFGNTGDLNSTVKQLWHIRIEGTLNEFDNHVLEEVFEKIHQLSEDATLELVRRDRGSIVLVFRGTEEGYKKIAGLFDRGKLSKAIGAKVLAVEIGEPERTTPALSKASERDETLPIKESSEADCTPTKPVVSRKLFVGGLSWGTTDDGLHSAFSQFGEIVEAKVITDRETGRSRGFGFVAFANNEGATRAVSEMDGSELDGRTIKVNEAEDKPARSGHRPGRGGGRPREE